MTSMGAGKLRHRIALQSLTAGSPQKSGSGMPLESWTTIATVNAAVEPLTGRELFAAQEHHSEVTTRISIRYRSDVTAKMRVYFKTRIFNIRYLRDPEESQSEYMQLLCTQGVNEG